MWAGAIDANGQDSSDCTGRRADRERGRGELEREKEREETQRETGEVRTESILKRPEWDTQTIAVMMAKVQWTRRSDESRT